MLRDRIERKWIEAFVHTFELCAIRAGDAVSILSETQSRQVNVELAELALLEMGAKAFHVVMPTPAQEGAVPIRSTGASNAIQQSEPVIRALSSCTAVVDVTVEGLLHAAETAEILADGARIIMISNDHPEQLERLRPDPGLKPKVEAGVRLMEAAREMRVTSAAGTELTVDMEGCRIGGGWGFSTEPGTIAYWPGGLCACVPRAGSVNGTLVLDTGDMNLTFKRYLESPITLRIEDDYAVAIEGDGLDAELMRSYIAAWGDREAYATSHVGWGMNPAARWDSLMMYDKGHTNATEQRAFAGNFLYSTGANKFANRFSLGHFDLPLRNCSVDLDGERVVDGGKLLGELA